MATLYLIDPSFRDEGSHHADYVKCVAEAAHQAGYKVILGANRRLPLESIGDFLNLPDAGSLRPAFKYTTYQKCSDLAGMQRMKRLRRKPIPKSPKDSSHSGLSRGRNFCRLSIAGLLDKFQSYRLRKKQDTVIGQFARDCKTFFQPATFTTKDHVFFASISDLELIGLANYLARSPHSLRAQWHVQFHFNLFEGRPPEYEQQAATLQTVRSRLTAALAPLAYHNLSFYATTDELAEQYNQLGIGHFQSLAYPIATEFAPQAGKFGQPGLKSSKIRLDAVSGRNSTAVTNHPFKAAQSWTGSNPENTADNPGNCGKWSAEPSFTYVPEIRNDYESERDLNTFRRPLRVVCPGAIRREKGQGEYLPTLIQEIESSLLSSKKIQLIVQQADKKIAERSKLSLKKSCNSDEDAISIVPHPLPKADYIQLIRHADIGLLYYDSHSYYSRRAGILGELLSAGKPVIVPAGCWLAEQLAEPIFRHVEKWFVEREHRRLGMADFHWKIDNAPMHGGIINFDDARRPFHFESELGPTDSSVGLRFDWHWPCESGIYCRVEWEQLDESGSVIDRGSQILGHRLQQQRHLPQRKVIALIPIRSGASRIKFCLKNAFHHSSASLRNLELLIANSEGVDSESIPVGAVGVVVPDRASLAAGLLEVVTHYEHYRDSAKTFSHEWFERHHPSMTISQLTAPDQMAAKVA